MTSSKLPESLSVLWVDDEPMTVLGSRYSLESSGANVVHAETVDAALQALTGSVVDVVLLDQDLRPGDGEARTSGLAVIESLRTGTAGWANADAPFAFVTAAQRWTDEDKASALGGFLGIASKADDLSQVLRNMLSHVTVVPGFVGPDGRPLRQGTPAHDRLTVAFGTVSDQILSALAARPALFYDMHWRDFEIVVAEIWKRNGWEVILTPASGDGGVDIYAARKTGIGRLLYVIDCKRYKPDRRIGPDLVRQLRGVVARDNADCGVLMTTSSFTAGAYREGLRGPLPLSLRDLEMITQHLQGTPLI
jgi:CheY-like chemotaxis protein